MIAEDGYLVKLTEIAFKLNVDYCHDTIIEAIERLQAIEDKYNKMIESTKSNEVTVKIKIDTTELDKVEERINKIKNIKIENTIVTNNINNNEDDMIAIEMIKYLKKNGIKTKNNII